MLSRKYDKAIDTYAEIGLVEFPNVIPNRIAFVNGKLTRVDITNGGKGYITVPTYEFGNVGNGTDAEITLTMDANGTIPSATVKMKDKIMDLTQHLKLENIVYWLEQMKV